MPGRAILLALVLCGAVAHAQGRFPTGSAAIVSPRPFLRSERPLYRNFTFDLYDNYPNHPFPFDDTPRALYGPLGDFLANGYDLYSWKETRVPGQKHGSSISKPNEMLDLAWQKGYDGLVMGRDRFGQSSYSPTARDNLIAHLSPLTLSKTAFKGVRVG